MSSGSSPLLLEAVAWPERPAAKKRRTGARVRRRRPRRFFGLAISRTWAPRSLLDRLITSSSSSGRPGRFPRLGPNLEDPEWRHCEVLHTGSSFLSRQEFQAVFSASPTLGDMTTKPRVERPAPLSWAPGLGAISSHTASAQPESPGAEENLRERDPHGSPRPLQAAPQTANPATVTPISRARLRDFCRNPAGGA